MGIYKGLDAALFGLLPGGVPRGYYRGSQQVDFFLYNESPRPTVSTVASEVGHEVADTLGKTLKPLVPWLLVGAAVVWFGPEVKSKWMK